MGEADVVGLDGPGFRVVHCRLPAWEAEDVESVSLPGSVSVAFTGQSAAVVRPVDRAGSRVRAVVPDAVEVIGDQGLAWLRASEPSDLVEITAGPGLRREIADSTGVPGLAALADVETWADPVLPLLARRLRAGLRGWSGLTALQAEEIVRAAYARTLQVRFGAAAAPRGALAPARLGRVVDLVHDRLADDLGLAELAAVTGLSPFHFARAFRAAVGVPPHRYVLSAKVGRARELLAAGATVQSAAAAVGFANLHHFRRLFRDQFGANPAAERVRPAGTARSEATGGVHRRTG
ncbi:MAG TPA: AraC family transcriptional regulator [Pseudonocardia sp.]|nr:AraC family transcriptional regulator [Pseudonocardia sp.]